MQGVTLNGCDVSTYSRLSKKCRKCVNNQFCSDKRMEDAAAINMQVNSLEQLALNAQIAAEKFSKCGVSAAEALKKAEIARLELKTCSRR